MNHYLFKFIGHSTPVSLEFYARCNLVLIIQEASKKVVFLFFNWEYYLSNERSYFSLLQVIFPPRKKSLKGKLQAEWANGKVIENTPNFNYSLSDLEQSASDSRSYHMQHASLQKQEDKFCNTN